MKEGGVLDGNRHVIATLTRDMLHTTYKDIVYQTSGDDVTGGMRHKIATALELSKKVERIYIASLCDDSLMRIAAGSHAGSRIASTSHEHEKAHPRRSAARLFR